MTDLEILGIKLICTCGACPEQYDAFYEGKYVGYFRLRHGDFSVEYPDAEGECLLFEHPEGDGMFNAEERQDCLTRGCLAILQRMGKGPRDWRHFILKLSQEKKDKLLMNLLEWQLEEVKGDGDIRFTLGEDPDYQGTYTANADIYWNSCGKSLLE